MSCSGRSRARPTEGEHPSPRDETMADLSMRPVAQADRPHPAVAIRNVTKRFGEIVACDGVNLDLQRGEVHGILGENGAGKSTLMRILIGLVLPDSGEITIDGRFNGSPIPKPPRRWASAWCTSTSASSTRCSCGRTSPSAKPTVSTRAARPWSARSESVTGWGRSRRLGRRPHRGQRQRVEIIKCLRRDPDIVVFDEPTSVLTPEESEQLFAVLRAPWWRNAGGRPRQPQARRDPPCHRP